MPSEILIALITLCGSLFGSAVGAIGSSRLTNYRLEQLEKQVGSLETKVDDMADITQRLALLEQKVQMYEKAKV